jgi:geranylgeranyl reductase family protein
MKMAAVVGGGPVGLKTAISLSEEGWETVLIEEHKEIGRPVQCTGLISKSGVKELDLSLGGVVVNEVRGAKIVSPNGTTLVIERPETVAFVINREAFDKKLENEAKRKGVEIRKKTKLIDFNKETLFVQSNERGEMIKSRVIIGADGVNSKVRKAMALEQEKKAFVHSMQVRAKGRFDSEFVELHFNEFYNGLFAWIVPESNEVARIGLAVKLGINPRDALKGFIHGMNLEILSESAGMIPIGKPLKEVVKENVLLVGDAAFQTKATTGGGIITGITAANIAAKTVSNHFKHHSPLTDYKKELSSLNHELELHWKIRKYLNSLTNPQLDKVFEKLKKAGIEKFLSDYGDMDKPSKFLNKILWSPKNWGLLPEGLKILIK